MEIGGISVVVLGTPQAIGIRAQVELATEVRQHPDAVICFATGATFQGFFREITAEVAAGRLDLDRVRATHLDEFVDFEAEDPGGFAHELLQCPPLGRAYAEHRFFPVPSSGGPGLLREHAEHLAHLGGVRLAFLGIGDNGHVACNEPGSDPDLSYHRATLSSVTRARLESRFAPDPVPIEAVTAGPRDLLAARRLVMVATGPAKAKAVRDMLEGEIGPACPASIIRRHPEVLVLLDGQAAAALDWPHLETATGR